MFDAGAIEARLVIKLDQAERDLDRIEARVEDFERKPHKVKITAAFEGSVIGRARTLFAQLDNQLSRDAANRLRSSPQGSVLGTLNALFSPHPVTGSPTALQSGTQGQLGRMINAPVTRTVRTRQQDTIVDSVLGVDKTTAKEKGAQAAQAAEQGADDQAARSGGGFWSKFFSFRRTKGGGGGGDVLPPGGGGPGGGGVGGKLFNAAAPGILGLNAKWASLLGLGGAALGGIPALGAIGAGAGVLGGGAALLIKSNAQLQAQAKSMLSSLESTFTAAAQPLLKPLQQVFAQIPKFFSGIGPQLKSVFSAAAPLLKPLVDGLEMLVKNLLPGLTMILKAAAPAFAVFKSFLGDIGTGLSEMFSAFSKVIGPASTVLGALLKVVTGLLPIIGDLASGLAVALAPAFKLLASIIKSLEPVLAVVGKIFAEFAGAVLGDLISALAPVAQLLNAISPSLVKLADAFGQVFTVLENKGVFAQIADIIEAVAKPLASFINTVVGILLPVLPPVIDLFSQIVFIFSKVGIALVSQLLPPLAKLVESVLRELAKILPQLIPFVEQFLNAFTGAVIQAITQLIPPLTKLAMAILPALSAVLPAVVPILSTLLGLFTPVVVHLITDIATALTAIIDAIPAPVLTAIALAIGAIVLGIKAWAVVQAILDAELLANPIGLVIAAVALLVVAIVELVKHWGTVWKFIKEVAGATWNFLKNDVFDPIGHYLKVAFVDSLNAVKKAWDVTWGAIKRITGDVVGFVTKYFKFALVFLGPAGLLALGAIEFAQHWRTIITDVAKAGSAAWNWLESHFFEPLHNALFDVVDWFESLPGKIINALSGLADALYNLAKNAIGSLISGLENSIPGGSAVGHFLGGALHAIGLAKGGLLSEPVIGYGTRTGQLYTLAEKEPEWVVPTSGGGNTPFGSSSGQGGVSQLANNIYIMQPEGLTLAQAFSELHYQLQVAKMQGYVGAPA